MLKVIQNYIYMYHTKSWCILPGYPEQVTDSTSVNFSPTEILGRSAPIYTYAQSGPRAVSFDFRFHRDMMNDINLVSSNFNIDPNEDVLEALIKGIQSAALPRYSTNIKAVTPPMVAIRLGNEIFIKGVISGSVQVTYDGPINQDDKYSTVAIAFGVNEIDPYDADSIKLIGSFRGFEKNLHQDIFK